MIVDDNSSQRLLLNKLLSKSLPFQMTLIEARDGEEAVLFTQQHQPDLILMDLRMPRTDGYQAIRRIRSWEATQTTRRATRLSSIPIIAISADVYPSSQAQAFDAGCDEFISKPYVARQICALVQKHLAATDQFVQGSNGAVRYVTA